MSVTCISLVSSSSVPIRRLSAAAPRWLKLLWIQTVLSCHCNNTIGWYGARYELFNQSSLALQTFQFKTQVIHWWGASICRLHRLRISGRVLYLPVAADLIFPDSPACLGWYGCKKWTYTTWCLVQFGPRCPANHQIGAYWTVMREGMWLMLLETWFGGNEDGELQSPSWFRSVFLFVFHPHWCSPLSIGFMSAFWSSRQADTTSSSFPHIPSSPPWRFFSWQTSRASPPKAKPASPGPLSSQLGFLQTSIKLAVLIQPP